MEAVKAFNLELSSLYEVKPPISKAKMTAITRGAIKAIKFYKHVVQSVEKFILKCKPEYKVPGLYVIDSIVRQSRHQFGPEKDVFAPRFSKNLQQTFVNLFKCPPEDKSKIIRVLNLWQKNQVFPPEVIQPLFDLADPNNPIHQQMQQSTPVQQTNGSQSQVVKGSPALQRTPTKANQTTASEAPTPNLSLTEPVLQQLQQLQRLLSKGADAARPEQVHFDKKLLDFDYGEDEDEVHPSPRPPAPAPVSTDPVTSLLTNPEVLRQLQTLQNTLAGAVNPPVPDAESERIKKMQEMKMQEDEFDKHLAQTVPNLPFAAECDFKISQTTSMIGGLHFIPPQPDVLQMGQGYDSQHDSNVYGSQNSANDVEVITLDHDDSRSEEDRYKRKRSRSRSRDRGRDKDRRRRSRSRSRSRGRRHRSKSKERKEKDKKEKEKETERDKERKKRGLPAIKKDHLSVCSTTLWVGHLSKLVHQDDLSNTFGEFGDIVSIDLIVPRGCAFIVMHRRQDAARCLAKLKNHNLHGKAITLAWAPGKGVKGKDLKDYWEGDLGVSYIPWSKVREDMDLEALEDGGMIDEDTMPDWMRKKLEASIKKAAPEQPPFLLNRDVSNHSTVDTSQPPPLPPTSLMQPPMLPMVNPFQLNNRFLSMIPNLANLPLGVPPPNIAPPNMPPSMMPNLGLGLGSPFQGPPSFMPPTLPPPQTEAKPAPPPTADTKLRNLSESLMNLAGPPLTMPPQIPMNQPPPPLHTPMDDNMDVEMEDAVVHPDMNKPPPNIPLSEQLQASMNASPFNRESRRDDPRFSPPRRDSRDGRDRRDDRSNDRSRRRSRSRDRDRDRNDRSGGRDRDRRDRDRDFGRGGRDRDRDRDIRDRRTGDRDRGRWVPPDRRDDRRDGPFDRRGGPPDRRDGPVPMGRRDDRRDGSYDRSRRDLPDRRDSDSRDKGDREKTLNDRLKEMAGMKFDEQGRDDNRSPRGRQLSESKDDTGKDILRFEPPIMSDDIFANPPPPGVAQARSPTEARNPSPPDFSVQPPTMNTSNGDMPHDQSIAPPDPAIEEDTRLQFVNPPPDSNLPGGDGPQHYDQQRDSQFGHGSYGNNEDFGTGGSAPYDYDTSRPGPYGPPGPYGSDGPGAYGPDGPSHFGSDGPGRFGSDGPRFRDQGPPFGGDTYGPPPDVMMDGPPGFGPEFGPPPGFDGPPDVFMRGGRRGRGRGRGRGRDGPDFFPRDDFGPPMLDDGFGPPMRDDFGPPMRDDFGPPMRDDFGPPMRGDFGSRGPRIRGRGFFNRGGPRGRGGPPFRDGPPGFMPEFESGPPPDFFRGGPRGRPFGEPFHRGGRGRGFRGGRGRPDFFDGPPPEFFDGPPGHPESGPPFEGALPYDDGPPGESPVDFGGRRGRGGRKRNSRWGSNEDDGEAVPNVEGDGGGTPLRDEIDDCGQQDSFEQHHEENFPDAGATPVEEPPANSAAFEEQGAEERGEGEGEGGDEAEAAPAE